MRRPLAVYGFSLLACGFCFFLFDGSFLPWAGVLTAILSVVLTVIRVTHRKNRILCSLQGCCMGVLCGCILLGTTVGMYVQPLASCDNTAKTLTMQVEECGDKYETVAYYIVSAKGLYQQPNKTARIRLAVSQPSDYRVGDTLRGEVMLNTVDVHQKASLASNGIFLTARLESSSVLTKTGRFQSFRVYAHEARERLLTYINQNLSDETAAMVTGICLGDTQQLSPRTVKQFSRAGISHMVAVSGLHTGMVSSLLLGLLLILPIQKRFVKVFSVGMVWFFICMAQLPYSACRAGIMFTVVALGSLFYRKPDLLNTLGGATLLILAVDPFAAGDVGFLASVSACLGIALFATPLVNLMHRPLSDSVKHHKGCSFILNGVAVTLSAMIGTLPCIFLCFYRVPLGALAVNVLGIPLATGVLAFGLISFLLQLIPVFGFTAKLILAASGVCANGLLKLAAWFGGEQAITVPFVSFWCWLGCALVLTGGIVAYKNRQRWRVWAKTSVAILLAVLVFVGIWFPASIAKQSKIFLVGDAYDGSVILWQDHKAAVIGCARPYAVEQALASLGLDQVEWLIVPENAPFNTDLKTLLSMVQVKNLMMTQNTRAKGMGTGLEGLNKTIVSPQSFMLGDMRVTVPHDLNGFRCQANGYSVTYNCAAKEPPCVNGIAITHPKVLQHEGFCLYQNNTMSYIQNNTTIVWGKGAPRLYSSVFV